MSHKTVNLDDINWENTSWKDLRDASIQERFTKKNVGLKIEPKSENQKTYIDLIYNRVVIMACGSAGAGKAQPLDAKVLTPTGWKNIGSLSIGDYVSCPDGSISKINGVYPQGKKEIFKITFKDGSSTEACGEHLWKVWWNYKWNIVNTKEMLRILSLKAGSRLSIPLIEPYEGIQENLPIDPYLMGFILGDGGLTIGVRYTSADQELVDKINNIIKKYDCYSTYYGKYAYTIRGIKYHENKVRQEFQKFGLVGKKSHDKFIPEIYLNCSLNDRMELIRGLMDTDGTVGKGGNVTYSTVSLQLAKQVQYLIRSIGGICNIREKHTSYTGSDKVFLSYTLNIRHKNPKSLFSLKRKRDILGDFNQYSENLKRNVVSVEKIENKEAVCISIDHQDHLYITDDFTVTHNTFIPIGIALKMLEEEKIEKFIVTRPMVECGRKLGAMPGDLSEKYGVYIRPIFDNMLKFITKEQLDTYLRLGKIEFVPLELMRGSSLDNSFILLDEAQNVEKVQMLMLLTRIGQNTKCVICGDLEQQDNSLNFKDYEDKYLGLAYAMKNLIEDDENFGKVTFTEDDIVRSKIVKMILRQWKEGA